MLPIFFCLRVGETWSFTRRKEYKIWVFAISVLRNTFGSKGEAVTGSWRKLRNEELDDLRFSPNIIRMI